MSATRALRRSLTNSSTRRRTAIGLTGALLVAPAGVALPVAVAHATAPTQAEQARAEAPVTLKATYKLDGKKISREDLAGKSGVLETTYVVRNTTAQPTEIRYKDGNGKEIVETADVVTPYVGRLAVTVPEGFGGIEADGAEVAGEQLAWSLVLFNPVGEPAQRLQWTAKVSDAQVPPATLQVARVTPTGATVLRNGLVTAKESATGSAALTQGVGKIDASVLKLRDGATQLLDGLVKLSTGAGDLRAGLADKAAPGADTLSEGLGKAAAGGSELSAGLGKLDAGAGKLSDGLGKASAGSEKLRDGSVALSGGADQVAGGAQALSDGLAQISGGLDQLAAAGGLPAAGAGAAKLRAGVDQLSAGVAALTAGLGKVDGGLAQAKGGVDAVKAGIDASLASGGSIDTLVQSLRGIQALSADPAVDAALEKLVYGVTTTSGSDGIDTMREKSAAASAALGQISFALGKGSAPDGTPMIGQGIDLAEAGLAQVAAGLASGDAAKPGLAEGLDALVVGLTTAVNGVTALQTGAQQASAGSVALAGGSSQVAAGAEKLAQEGAAPLASGLSQLLAGSQQLAAGTGSARAGAEKLDDGLGQLDTGAKSLADGLDDAAEGSGKLEDGIVKVRDGVQAVRDGANELSGRGTSALGGSVNATALLNAQKVAMLEAVAARGAEDPEEQGFDVVLASAETDEGSNALLLAAGAAGLGVLALGGTGFVLARRRSEV